MNNNSLSMVEAKLPPGFRFHPRDEELVCDYLMKKITSSDHLHPPFLIEVDLNKCEPWDIPEMACVGGREWYFYSQRDKKYATGLRTNRATISGYWKATGKDRPVSRKGNGLVGMRKTLVFYQGRAPKGRKSDWVMHEFRLEPPPLTASKVSPSKEDWVLCRVFHKNKEVAAKQATRGSLSYDHHHDIISSSSSLPPLMEPYITFDQTTHHPTNNLINNEYEQVPCFSIFNPGQTTSPTLSNLALTHTNLSTITSIIPIRDLGREVNHRTYGTTNWDVLGGLPENNIVTQYPISMSSTSSDDKKVLKAVLDQLTKMESNLIFDMKESPASFGSEQSFLSEEGLPTIWTQQY